MRLSGALWGLLLIVGGCGSSDDISPYVNALLQANEACADSIAASAWAEFDKAIEQTRKTTLAFAADPTVPPSLEKRLAGTGLSIAYELNYDPALFGDQQVNLTVEFEKGEDTLRFSDAFPIYSFSRSGVYAFESKQRSIPVDDLGFREVFPEDAFCETSDVSFRKHVNYDIIYSAPDNIINSERIYSGTTTGKKVTLRVAKEGTEFVVKGCINGSCDSFRTDDADYMHRVEARLIPHSSVPSTVFLQWRTEFKERLWYY